MSDTVARQLALRNRLLGTVVATTGTASLAATATGYSRAAGSFVTDKFAVGMEVLVAGFAGAALNGYKVVTGVTATLLSTQGGNASTEAATGNESIVCGLPEGRAYDNSAFTPTAGRPYIAEEMAPGPRSIRTFPVSRGRSEESGLYIVKYFGLSDKGFTAIRRFTDAVIARFASGTAFSVGTATLRISGQPGPRAGQALPQGDGWTVCLVTIPYVATSQNAVAA